MFTSEHLQYDCLYVLKIHQFKIVISCLTYTQVLTFGQVYRISLQLEMPDSPTNHDLGMFMIKTTCFSEHGGQVAASARSVSCTFLGGPTYMYKQIVNTYSDSYCHVFLRQDNC